VGVDGAGTDASQGSDAGGMEGGSAGGDASEDAPGEAGGDDGGGDAGWVPALSFGTITAEVPLPMAGTFDIALVDVGAIACRAPKVIAQVTLVPKQTATVAIMGLATADAGSDSALSLLAFADEQRSDPVVRVRVIHAALGLPGGVRPAPSLAARIGDTAIAQEVDARHAASQSAQPAVDSLGYATLPAAINGPAVLRFDALGDAAAASWTTDPVDFNLVAAAVSNAFVVNRAGGKLGVVWCQDPGSRAPTYPCPVYDAPQR
jgi:hypothetical protein